jgi:predicted tellurium resistance membrane protein TerC
MLTYLTTGLLIAIGLELLITTTKSVERLTFSEIWACIVFWPAVIILVIIGILNNQK